MNSALHLKAKRIRIITKKIVGILICMFLIIIPIFSFCVASSADNWSMFHHDLLHTGYSSSTAPITNNVHWSFSTNDCVYSSPTIVDGRLYVGSDDQNVYCLDAEDGHELWNSPVGGEVWESSPAVANDMVYICGGSTLYCLNAENGSTIWSYATGNPIRPSPVVVNDRVYIGSWDKKVYCFDADTSDGEDEGYDDLLEPPIVNYDLIWIFETGNLVDSSPAVYDNKVFIGSNDNKVYCVNATNGIEIWNFTTGGNVFSSPAIANDKVYVGSYDHKVYCINANNGEEDWSFTTGDRVASSPAIHDGKVYVGSNDDNVYCLDALTGDTIWDSPFETGNNVFSSPAIADDKVYIGSEDNKVYCLYSTDGTKIWEYTTGGSVSSSPAVYEGKVYVGSLDKKVYCFKDIPDTNEPPRRPSQPIGQTDGTIDVEYTFATTTSDPEGDPIYYWFDWGDNTNSGWITASSKSHSWSQRGTYQIKVKAKDIHGAESAWSNPSTIDIVEPTQEEPKEQQFIFGTVLDDLGTPIEDARVCAIIDDTTSKCKITGDQGAYYISVSTGTYTVVASKDGYYTSTQYDIVVEAKQAIQTNFVLSEMEKEPEVSGDVNKQIMQAAIDAAREDNKLVAEINIQQTTQEITTYRDIEVEFLEQTKDTLKFNIDGEGSGAIIVIRVDKTQLSDINNIEVTYDDIPIEMGNIASIFNLEGDTPYYGILITRNEAGDPELNVILYSPHFSEHTITITSILETLQGVTAILYYIGFFALAGIIFATVVIVFLVKFVYSKK